MITSVAAFVAYFESVRRRTLNYVAAAPADRAGWAPRPGEFSCAEIIRHLAAAERMFTGVAVAGRWDYHGHASTPDDTIAAAQAELAAAHSEALAALATLDDAALGDQRTAVGGQALPVWRVLMLMVEHEVHHRSQLASYLSAMGLEPPQIYGMKVEELIAKLSS